MRSALTGLLVILAAGCFSTEIVGSRNIRGSYELRSVNGQALPFVTQTGSVKVETLVDSMTLNTGETFSQMIHTRTTTNGQVTTRAIRRTGTFLTQGTSITFRTNETGTSALAIYTPNTLTFIESGVTSVYTK